jgi:hypothetical protein
MGVLEKTGEPGRIHPSGQEARPRHGRFRLDNARNEANGSSQADSRKTNPDRFFGRSKAILDEVSITRRFAPGVRVSRETGSSFPAIARLKWFSRLHFDRSFPAQQCSGNRLA